MERLIHQTMPAPITSAIPNKMALAHKIRRSLRLMTGAIAAFGLPTLKTPISREPSIIGAATYITELSGSAGFCNVLRAPY
ncbi:Uncharacterised protein [Shigella sonnei]|nr:Uncharacterised protein [Shigella sonnei]CSF52303.1 Uncharacterised protein [Shigella sonnei]CSG02733.1 Uncharacterised protein [Shigella sonnei]CSP78047.1 Uncharacterised protein [Shigella sonnei]CSR42489.1 Uncharacterised protein [Shigella sonnei]